MASPGEDYHAQKSKAHLDTCAREHERLNKHMTRMGEAGKFNDMMDSLRRNANDWTLTVSQHGLLRDLFMTYFGEGSSII